MASKRLTLSSASSSTTFRPSPLNPLSPTIQREATLTQQKRNSFPASRPLRPFPSIAHSTPKFVSSGSGVAASESSPSSTLSSIKRGPKTIELSSKWKGGFIVLGMTQAEFSRQDD
ncbi:hypothetical protein M422DRAFT_46779 [Sphaerobolus stellatus SS14]|uniref:Unplaced genomic scaffold SPHSTscaffold_36, whole genome shotgun sequence n=1 Tax=Sphaerobolus stellatus (strain SS14) TaxID=990650 RepID=A0A0C9W3H3_SPHS4|nr:hypothetical protein M422DRAFT_46779 [Sphaerobolus stellatus SS14]